MKVDAKEIKASELTGHLNIKFDKAICIEDVLLEVTDSFAKLEQNGWNPSPCIAFNIACGFREGIHVAAEFSANL